jgi:hypothetical protein
VIKELFSKGMWHDLQYNSYRAVRQTFYCRPCASWGVLKGEDRLRHKKGLTDCREKCYSYEQDAARRKSEGILAGC